MVCSTTLTIAIRACPHGLSRTVGEFESQEMDFGELVRYTTNVWFDVRLSCTTKLFCYGFVDPPKAISDIVEAILGAVHVDGGFEQGRRAAIHLLSPILNVLLKSREDKRDISLRHPKKMLQELGGELLELHCCLESEFYKRNAKTFVLLNGRWGHAHRDGSNFVATVEFLGNVIVAVSDSSSVVGKNRACALVVRALQENPKLRESLHMCRAKVESGFSRAAAAKAGSSDDQENDETVGSGKKTV